MSAPEIKSPTVFLVDYENWPADSDPALVPTTAEAVIFETASGRLQAHIENGALFIRASVRGGCQIVVRPGDEEIRISVDEREAPRRAQ